MKLSQAGDQLMRYAFRPRPEEAWEQVARCFYEHIPSAACALFLTQEDPSRRGQELKALWPQQKAGDARPGFRFPMAALVPDRGAEGKVSPPELYLWAADPPSRAVGTGHEAPEVRVFGACSSSLRIALTDRKGWVLGVAILAAADARVPFAAEDMAAAALLAAKAALLLENVRIFTHLRDLMGATRRARNFSDVRRAILHTSVSLLRADRGDIAFYDWDKRDLVEGPQLGTSNVSEGQALPKQGLMRKVWDNGGTELVPDVTQLPKDQYYRGNPDTRSELVTRLEWGGRRIGVLNVESFQRNGFDEEDRRLLELVAEYAANDYLRAGKDADLETVMQQLAEHWSRKQEIALGILKAVRAFYGFDGGIIYVPDYPRKRLRG